MCGGGLIRDVLDPLDMPAPTRNDLDRHRPRGGADPTHDSPSRAARTERAVPPPRRNPTRRARAGVWLRRGQVVGLRNGERVPSLTLPDEAAGAVRQLSGERATISSRTSCQRRDGGRTDTAHGSPEQPVDTSALSVSGVDDGVTDNDLARADEALALLPLLIHERSQERDSKIREARTNVQIEVARLLTSPAETLREHGVEPGYELKGWLTWADKEYRGGGGSDIRVDYGEIVPPLGMSLARSRVASSEISPTTFSGGPWRSRSSSRAPWRPLGHALRIVIISWSPPVRFWITW
jgi:hypothetical protein